MRSPAGRCSCRHSRVSAIVDANFTCDHFLTSSASPAKGLMAEMSAAALADVSRKDSYCASQDAESRPERRQPV